MLAGGPACYDSPMGPVLWLVLALVASDSYHPDAVRLDVAEMRATWVALRAEVASVLPVGVVIEDSMSATTTDPGGRVALVVDGKWVGPDPDQGPGKSRVATSLGYELRAGSQSLFWMLTGKYRFVSASGDEVLSDQLVAATQHALGPHESWWGSDGSYGYLLLAPWALVIAAATTMWVRRRMSGVAFACALGAVFVLILPGSAVMSDLVEAMFPGFALRLG